MDAHYRRGVSIDAPTPRLLVVGTLILFLAVAKTICPIPEVRAAGVAVTASFRSEIGSIQRVGMRLLKAEKAS
jgi:hypothetical protein